MTTAFFDCYAGAGGDMIVAALLDAGASLTELQAALSTLGLDGFSVSADKTTRGAIAATKFDVAIGDHDHHSRHLGDILAIISQAGLPERTAERAHRIFARLAEAEAAVHGIGVEEVHFHEVGAVDSIVDIVGACIALELLGGDNIYCSPIALGNGLITCSHGKLPAPSPATSQLTRGVRVAASPNTGEATTPTAAAILTTLAESFGEMPAMKLQAVGCGAGTREGDVVPNILRVFVGEVDRDGNADTLVELSANIDDCTGEIIGATIEMLIACGCMDAWACPIVMKKSRPAWKLSALCDVGNVQQVERIIFTETTTFGIRRVVVRRSKLHRHRQSVETQYGPIHIKIGSLGDEEITASPEFSDCLSAAQSHHVALREVLRAATAAYDRGESK